MNNTSVPLPESDSCEGILAMLAGQLDSLTPEMRKAASHVVEHPTDIGVSSIREMADAADVKPNTLVRLARTVGFEGYEDFRAPFREVHCTVANGIAEGRAKVLVALKPNLACHAHDGVRFDLSRLSDLTNRGNPHIARVLQQVGCSLARLGRQI